ncbi:MAG: type II secretion system protein GspG [Planctomycetes bacterium]|nr:type II secretion system protein GspG [Planctomycetota bacterium]MCW8135289.1 type II secretion system protein GspG [Planctomycetota bacterium]
MNGSGFPMRARTLVTAVLLLCLAVTALAQDDDIARADRTRMRETRETMRSLMQDLRAWAETHENAYPEKLQALVEAGLRKEVPKDAWGNAFQYKQDSDAGYRLVSLGSDGKAGGEGAAADITFTRNGELVELKPEQKAELERRRDEQRHEARLTLARARMVVCAEQALNFRRENQKWPGTLADAMRKGDTPEDKRVNACFNDPWGNPFELRVLPADNVAIICRGEEGAEDGTGRNADFVVSERDVRRKTRQTDRWGDWRPNTDWQAQSLAEEIEAWRKLAGRLPNELADLTRPVPMPDGKQQNALRNVLPTDNWGREYIYLRMGDDDFAVIGLGKDALAGGIREDADVIFPEPGSYPQERRGRGGAVIVRPKERTDQKEHEAKAEVAAEQMRDLAEKLSAFKQDKGSYPEKLADVADRMPSGEIPKDPWDSDFSYERTEAGFKLTCTGSDRAAGGQGHAADIVWTEQGRAEPKPEPEPEPEPAPED